MGHKLHGSMGSYFNSHDVDEITRKYTRCDFARPGVTLLEDVKKEMFLTMWREQAEMVRNRPDEGEGRERKGVR